MAGLCEGGNEPSGSLKAIYLSIREPVCFKPNFLEKMPHKFSTAQYADIVYVYGLCVGSSLRAVAEYERRFPKQKENDFSVNTHDAHFDYCDILFTGLSVILVQRLQRVHNIAVYIGEYRILLIRQMPPRQPYLLLRRDCTTQDLRRNSGF
ncbi:hypothetical protein ANN_18466 [Periplaneta americana]|uniref:DUF4817 domain-containing protein n=1 Tax=Periplaneta americana TaxID=6978 RepID=A0ABQ8SQB5_PERAM|nr:hypothetical protein ANN_18466 [Periplaneta americana]